MHLPRALAPAFLILAQLPTLAAAEPPSRESTLVIYGDDPCPRSDNPDEVVVCARRPESERFRVPRSIRERQSTAVAWGARVEGLEAESRYARPNSCSVVGSYGFTGCAAAMIQQWYAERRARRAEEASIP